jgi:meiotically up-regulated gene 157 (Mug157) protein
MSTFISQRPAPALRKFTSAAVERTILATMAQIKDEQLGWLFANCFPNTLDTTIRFARDVDGRPDTFVITGDIDAMWLRDSTAQVWPYLSLARNDEPLRELLAGVLRRQTACIRLDPYANAFYRDPVMGEWRDDHTGMIPGVHERKWEVDSLLYFLRLSHGYWQATSDLSPFDADWRAAIDSVLVTLRAEQSGIQIGRGSSYRFCRTCNWGDSLANRGRGDPAKSCGLVRGAFRPSDDQTKLPYHLPSNAMAVVVLRDLAKLLTACGNSLRATNVVSLATEIAAALEEQGPVIHPQFGEIWAYEIDGYGGRYLMDDANVPSLLALPYLGFCATDDSRYLRTRAFCLSADNPYYSSGRAAAGIGSPHTWVGSIWPISLMMQALTATADAEILTCLGALKTTHAHTGFMHESFSCHDATQFTRPWFAWANTLFGELILTLSRERPHLLASPL